MWYFFPKLVFQPILAALLNFPVNCKNAFIWETVQNRAILMNFSGPPGYMESHLTLFAKYPFPAISDGYLKFLCKTQKHIYLGSCSKF